MGGKEWNGGVTLTPALTSRFLLTVGQMQCGASSTGREEVTRGLILTARFHPLRHPTLPQTHAKSWCSVYQVSGRRGGAGRGRVTFISVVLYSTGALQEAHMVNFTL